MAAAPTSQKKQHQGFRAKWTSSDGDFVRVLKEPLKDAFPFSFFNMIQI
jgi:hypothetical protein